MNEQRPLKGLSRVLGKSPNFALAFVFLQRKAKLIFACIFLCPWDAIFAKLVAKLNGIDFCKREVAFEVTTKYLAKVV